MQEGVEALHVEPAPLDGDEDAVPVFELHESAMLNHMLQANAHKIANL